MNLIHHTLWLRYIALLFWKLFQKPFYWTEGDVTERVRSNSTVKLYVLQTASMELEL